MQERDRKSTVIKLAENHVAIDFLILDDDGTKAHNVLYFVQVSTRKYQDRLASNRLGAIKEKSTHTASKTPLNIYATELEVDESRCYFVYASPLASTHASPLASTSYIHIHLLLCIYSMRKKKLPVSVPLNGQAVSVLLPFSLLSITVCHPGFFTEHPFDF